MICISHHLCCHNLAEIPEPEVGGFGDSRLVAASGVFPLGLEEPILDATDALACYQDWTGDFG